MKFSRKEEPEIITYRGKKYRRGKQVGIGQLSICKGCQFDNNETACRKYSDKCNPLPRGQMLTFKLIR